MIYAGMVLYPRDQAPEVCRNMRDFLQDAPREVTGGVLLMHFPPAPFVPPELVGRPAVAVLAAYFGDPADGHEVLAPLREFGDPAVDIYQEMPYLALQQITDAGNPPGRRNYWCSDALSDLPDDAIDAFIACAAAAYIPGQRDDPGAGRRGHRRRTRGRRIRHRSGPAVDVPLLRNLDRPSRRRPRHRLGSGNRRGDAALEHDLGGPELRQRGGRGPGPRDLRSREAPPSGRAEGPLRPRQRVPDEPERQAEHGQLYPTVQTQQALTLPVSAGP